MTAAAPPLGWSLSRAQCSGRGGGLTRDAPRGSLTQLGDGRGLAAARRKSAISELV